jgi:hypothetical protein
MAEPHQVGLEPAALADAELLAERRLYALDSAPIGYESSLVATAATYQIGTPYDR